MNFNKYIGIPYKTGGREINGADCFGLVKLIFKDLKGIDLPDFTDLVYDKDTWDEDNHILHHINNFKSGYGFFTVDPPYQQFDCLIFAESRSADHIGVYIGDGKFLHTNEERSSMIGKLDIWSRKLYTTLRFKGWN